MATVHGGKIMDLQFFSFFESSLSKSVTTHHLLPHVHTRWPRRNFPHNNPTKSFSRVHCPTTTLTQQQLSSPPCLTLGNHWTKNSTPPDIFALRFFNFLPLSLRSRYSAAWSSASMLMTGSTPHKKNTETFQTHKGASSNRIDNTDTPAKSSIKLFSLSLFSPLCSCFIFFNMAGFVDRMWETSQLGSCWLCEDRFSRIFHTHIHTHTHTHT